MNLHIGLAGNPNSGKTTLFNELTGSHQYVGNWPGVTVEKKTGEYKKDSNIKITDLPGIYSLSPYTLEEVVTRDFLLNERPDVIIDVVDASNIERNLYLATQLSEIGIPLVLALNMMDVVEKKGDEINSKALEKILNCKVVEVSAIKNRNVDELISAAMEISNTTVENNMETFSPQVEKYIQEIENSVEELKNNPNKRWYAIKLFESDFKVLEDLNISDDELAKIKGIIKNSEEEFQDDGEGIITNERYNFVTKVTRDTVVKSNKPDMTERIDRIVTNRFLALPIFVGIMFFVYFLAIKVVGEPITDWVNEEFFGRIVSGGVENLLVSLDVAPWLQSLIISGIIGGVGGVLGFLPIISVLFLLISILEDVGYMSRIAFILDKVFRKFGLSGKSFIPILIGTGCAVPGILGTRTIENDNDRRMTIMVASFMPCGAKTEIIALFAAFLGGYWWFGPIWYFGGILAVIISGLILKKTRMFQGDTSPFIMELPDYHMPSLKNVGKATWHRIKSFVVKAGTVILLSTMVLWLLSNISTSFKFVEFENNASHSLLSFIGTKIAFIFEPLGFNDWMAAVATTMGLIAKELVVGTYGVVAGLDPESAGLIEFVRSKFDLITALSFMFFNQLTIPCMAAVGAIKQEMNDKKWFGFAIGYQVLFSYSVSLVIYQVGRIIMGYAPNVWTLVAGVILVIYIFLLVRPEGKKERLHRLSVERQG